MSGKYWYVYLLECADGTFYTGSTTDVPRRFLEHSKGKGAKYTRGRRPVILRASRRFPSREIACQVEAMVKRLSRKAKLAYMFGYQLKEYS